MIGPHGWISSHLIWSPITYWTSSRSHRPLGITNSTLLYCRYHIDRFPKFELESPNSPVVITPIPERLFHSVSRLPRWGKWGLYNYRHLISSPSPALNIQYYYDSCDIFTYHLWGGTSSTPPSTKSRVAKLNNLQTVTTTNDSHSHHTTQRMNLFRQTWIRQRRRVKLDSHNINVCDYHKITTSGLGL